VARVGFGHVGRISLGVDLQIRGIESAHGCLVRRIREAQCEFEVGVQIALVRRVERRRRGGGGHALKDIRREPASISGDAIVMVTLTLGPPRWITHL
jgi:hypothetical protein